MKKREQKLQTTFNHWVKAKLLPRKPYGAFVFELKHTRGAKSFPYRELKPHQEAGLLCAKNTGFTMKLSDFSPEQKPFDSFAIKGAMAYVVIMYPSKKFYLIDIDNYVFYRDSRATRKSLTEPEAEKICSELVEL